MSLYSSSKARGSLIDTAAYRLISQIATILGYVVMVRGMTKEDFGVLSMLYAFIPVVSTVASLGLEQTLRRYQPEYLQAGNTIAAAWLVRFVASARFGANVAVLSLVLLGWNHVAPVFKLAPYRAEFALFCLLMLLHFQARVLQFALAARMLHRHSVGSMAILAVFKLIAYCGLVWLHDLTLVSAIVADTLGYAVAYLVMRAVYRQYGAPAVESGTYRPSKVERRRLVRYGFFNNFNDAGTVLLNTKTDNFFIAAIIDPVSVGIYAFYTRLNEMTQNVLPVRLFENVVQPMFFALRQEERHLKIPLYFTFLLNMNLLLQWPVLAYCVTYHAEIVQVIFGGKFVEDSWLLPLIAGFATFNVVAVPVTLVVQYEEKAGVLLLSKVFAIYNAVALLALIPVFGVYGAAIASGSAQVLKNGFVWWHVRKYARWTNAKSALVASLVLWSAVAGAGGLLKTFAGDSAVLQLLTGGVLVAIGILVHVRGPAVAPSDRKILGAVLRGRERVVLRVLGLVGRGENREPSA